MTRTRLSLLAGSFLLVGLSLVGEAPRAQAEDGQRVIQDAIDEWCSLAPYAYASLETDGRCEFNDRGGPISPSARYRSQADIKGTAFVATRPPTGRELLLLSPKHAVNGHLGRHYEFVSPDGAVGVGVDWQRGDRVVTVRVGVYGFDEDVPADLGRELRARAEKTAADIDTLIDFTTPVVQCSAPVDRFAETDRALDMLATMLRGAVEQPDPVIEVRVFTPLVRRGPGGTARADWDALRYLGDGAEVGQLVWDISAGMISSANLGLTPLSREQLQRLKAYGHWAAWLKARAVAWNTYYAGHADNQNRALTSMDVQGYRFQRRDVPPPDVKLTADESVLRAALAGPIAVDVPPPPIRSLAAESLQVILDEEYGKAFVKSLAELVFVGGDAVYFGGKVVAVITTFQGFYNGDPLSGLVSGLAVTPFGPYAIGAYTLYLEANAIFFEEGPYEFEDHIANLAGLVNLGIAPFAHPKNKSLPTSAKPIDEGLRPWTAKFNGKSYREVGARRRDRRAVSADRESWFVDLEFVVPGPYVGKPKGAPGIEIKQIKGAKVVDVGDGPRYFDPKTGEPLIPVGEPGYHLWSHLVERKLGLKTGFTSIMKVFGKSPQEARLRKMVEDMHDPKADRGRINADYVEFFNELLSSPRQARTQSTARYRPDLPEEHVHQLQIWSECTQQHELVQVTASQQGQVMNVLVVPPERNLKGQGAMLSGKLMDDLFSPPTLAPFSGSEDWVN